MKRRCWLAVILLITCLCGSLSGPAAVQAQPDTKTLLLYDSLAVDTPKEGNVEELQRLLAAFGAQVTVMNLDHYTADTLSGYDRVIYVKNAPDLYDINKDFLKDMAAYTGDYLHIGTHLPERVQQQLHTVTAVIPDAAVTITADAWSSAPTRVPSLPVITSYQGQPYGAVQLYHGSHAAPFGVIHGRQGYVPYYVKGNASELALSSLLKDWLGVQKPGNLYLVIRGIYPFSDLEKLKALADRLYGAGIPFVVSVQPVFEHTDYPAMLRYLQAMQYVQARNGSIVINTPVVADTISQDKTVLKREMSSFIDVLAQHKIVPLGIGAELYWSYDHLYSAEGMAFFDSSLLYPNEKIMYRDRSPQSKVFVSSPFTVTIRQLQEYVRHKKTADTLPVDLAVTLNFEADSVHLDEEVAWLEAQWLVFADYKQEEHQVKNDHVLLQSRGGILKMNGQSLTQNSTLLSGTSGAAEADYAYTKQARQSLSGLFRVQNNIFVAIIGVTLLVFGLFLIIGYRLYKRKYYK
ncbi:hypothetical protein Q5741_16690 [Paenibacillus sp. JX-17]|uniref:DUF2334 domain-containing protein n=1 Tax=Paenibacillus lacisoli TaxID=3064525 RepID=A0ABT9CJE2_9BACL|nr:hypothetical protein [Paenibacillus sp. JX-17]MDO7908052.1 hypothetical protein [Paenibacillus sp. JX-17]